MFEMLIVEREKKRKCLKLYSPQIEGNKDCEVLRCVHLLMKQTHSAVSISSNNTFYRNRHAHDVLSQ